MTQQPKPFLCEHCNGVICTRLGNKIIEGRLQLELKETHNIFCSNCRRYSKFRVQGRGRSKKSLELNDKLK